LLGSGAKVLTGCAAGALFDDDTNPIAGLMIGILTTVLLQSSSTTTSIIVALVGAGAISVEPAIYMVMGANIGTSVTNTIVALGQMGDGDQLERAFAGATVHDMFNFLTVAVLLPVEAATHYLSALTYAITKNAQVSDGDKWEGPIKKIVSPLADKVIMANKKVPTDIASGKTTCADYYPVFCAGATAENNFAANYKTCADSKSYPDSRVGLITCNKSSGTCPAFFQNGASAGDDKASGGVTIVLGLIILIACLIGLVSILQKMLMGVSTRIIYKATNINGYLAMIIGAALTILVQSSSITTSVLTPLVGLGVIQLEQMFPLTLGANIGTTVTALLAAMVSDSIEALDVALAHLFFNITGIIIWYPIPFMRRVPLNAARTLGKGTRWWRGFPALYIAVMFFIMPLALLGLSYLFTLGSKGFTVLGSIITACLGLAIVYFVYWWHWRDGKNSTKVCFKKRQEKLEVINALPEDMAWLKNNVSRLMEHTCLEDEVAGAKELDAAEAKELGVAGSQNTDEEDAVEADN
jgi:sodium-dependent phosphate cotransporter